MELHVACLCVVYVHSVVVLLEVGGETLRGALAGSEVAGRKKTRSALLIFSPARRSDPLTERAAGLSKLVPICASKT